METLMEKKKQVPLRDPENEARTSMIPKTSKD